MHAMSPRAGQPLVIRVDASVRMGTGHVMRMIALARAWERARGRAVFALAQSTPGIEQRLIREQFEIVPVRAEAGSTDDARATATLAQQQGSRWVVVDGYHFGGDFQQALKQAGLRVLVVDDCGHAGHYSADLVLNQNLHATEDYYTDRESYTQLLLGPEYVQLRGEFHQWLHWRREIASVGRRVLVTLGGSDPDNLTAKVLSALAEIGEPELEVGVVIGGSNQHHEGLRTLARSLPAKVFIERDLARMDERMAWADVAVCSGGTTVWELAFMGLPSVIGQIGPAEDALVSGLTRLDLFTRVGWFRDATPGQIATALAALLRDPELRRQMSQKARTLIDGRGTERVVAHLQAGNT